MRTKLTLKLKRETISKGKSFARRKKTSLSRLIENYLDKLTGVENEPEISPIVKSLCGILAKNASHKSEYADYLIRKYR